MENIIIYDFDGTLTPYPIPKFKKLEEIGVSFSKDDKRYKEALEESKKTGKSIYEIVLKVCVKELQKHNLKISDKNITYKISELEFNPGTIEFLDMLNKNNVKNYIVSSGLKVYLKSCEAGKRMKKVYGTTFKDFFKKIIGMKHIMSDDEKVNAIKDIIKNKKNINLIYIGDGETDYPAFKYIKSIGGKNILVNVDTLDKEFLKLKKDTIIDAAFKADYSKNSDLYKYIIKSCNIKE